MGIYVKFTYPSSSSERVEIINNDISGMLGINADIQIYDAPYTYIYNNTISNSEDKGIAIFGIYGSPAYTSTDNRVQVIGNTISSTYYPGLQAANAPYTYFYNNTLTHCNYYGGDGTGDFDYASIHIDAGSANCLIDSNTVSDGINGIQLWSDDCTVINNEIFDMGLTYANTKTTIDGTYYNSAILYGDMYDVNMPTSATISCNNIYDNYWGLFVISTYTGTVNATLNWWGDVSGPYHPGSWFLGSLEITNPDGLGDEVSDYVLYLPWMGMGGFVTGGGWIDSPVNGDYDYMQVSGKASFGFVSKYKKGKNVPDGSTNFVFQAGDLHFHSSSYDWLVVTGSDYAKFKGTGTINGSGEYKFMIWAGDGGKGGDDTFTIKIWEEDEDGLEDVVYENDMDQVIDSGSIIIHTK
jgi:parallel beta-helix repeat protein